ncbi:MAG: transcriptional repressor LexA [Fimbriimonadaceae bacterium]|nr:transcriptional repressor LexA [Fimbriimonadaceae bacterium]
MAEDLSERQRDILAFIGDFTRNVKRPPAVREIGDGVGLSSPCTVYRHLETLEQRGYIRRDRGKARAIQIVHDADRAPEITNVPLVGTIAAGVPLLAEENRTGMVPVASGALEAGDHFAVTVKGDSMIEAGIMEGDVVVLRKQDHAEEGDIVAALTPHDAEGTATLKRFYRDGQRVRLQPANQTMAAIYVDARDDLRILGKAVLLTRALH